jgi:Leucine-rich repeat (LRR) protein
MGGLPLCVVNLSDNQLRELPSCLCGTTTLEQLNLQNNSLGEVNAGVRQLRGLKVLNLSHNLITCFNEELCELDSLTHLDLSFNRIEVLPQSVNNLAKLKELLLSDNQLNNESGRCLPPLQRLWELLVLDLSNNRLQLPPRFNDFSERDSIVNVVGSKGRRLKSLSLAHNQLKSFGEAESLVNLQELRLNDNGLERLEESVGRLDGLLLLRADGNQLSELPPLLLGSLTELGLARNRLEKFQGHKLKRLEVLDLADNLLGGFHSNFLPSLARLDLSSNRLDRLELADYPLLKTVALARNQLAVLPTFHPRCKPRSLSLENNSLSELPEAVSNLTSLRHLSLAYNQLHCIPSCLKKLRSL